MAKEIKLPFSELKGTLNDAPIEPTIEITENGVHNVKGYTYADVNVEGGSSDYSIASVTTSGSENVRFGPPPIVIYNDNLMTGLFDSPANILLYKGSQNFTIKENIRPITNVEGTGGVAVEYDSEYDEYLVTVTGDGTLTITTEVQ